MLDEHRSTWITSLSFWFCFLWGPYQCRWLDICSISVQIVVLRRAFHALSISNIGLALLRPTFVRNRFRLSMAHCSFVVRSYKVFCFVFNLFSSTSRFYRHWDSSWWTLIPFGKLFLDLTRYIRVHDQCTHASSMIFFVRFQSARIVEFRYGYTRKGIPTDCLQDYFFLSNRWIVDMSHSELWPSY